LSIERDLPVAVGIDDWAARCDQHKQECAEGFREQSPPLLSEIVEVAAPRGVQSRRLAEGKTVATVMKCHGERPLSRE